jgi:hypothetical protein
MESAEPQVEGRLLAVREEEGAYLVVRADDLEDWLVRFEKNGDFPAREWAENMVSVYNRRLAKRAGGPPTPPGTRPASYHPDGG